MAEWKEVYLSEDYIVSDEGEVARVKDGLILKQYPQKSGYVNVWLRLPYGNKSFPVHRLVCIAFHGIKGYKQGLFVDHIDTNRANNKASNLRWVTPKENANNPLTLKKRRKMATKKFIIEVEEGMTNCYKCPVTELDDYERCLVKDLIKCLDYNLATMKITEHQDWIKVEDRLPEYEETVMVACHYKDDPEIDYIFCHRTDRNEVLTDKNGFAIIPDFNITHWMHIVPPKED